MRRSRRAARRRISSSVIVTFPPPSSSWFCQRFLGSFRSGSIGMAASLIETAREKSFDPMDLGRDVSSRQSCQFADGLGVHPFEPGKNYLAIHGFQTSYQLCEMVKCHTSIGVLRHRCSIEFL